MKAKTADIIRVISEHLGVELARVKPTATLVSLGADELDLHELPMAMEDEFGFEFSADEVDGLVTVQAVIDAVLLKLG
jgi:acyl carrier protein